MLVKLYWMLNSVSNWIFSNWNMQNAMEVILKWRDNIIQMNFENKFWTERCSKASFNHFKMLYVCNCFPPEQPFSYKYAMQESEIDILLFQTANHLGLLWADMFEVLFKFTSNQDEMQYQERYIIFRTNSNFQVIEVIHLLMLLTIRQCNII